MPLSPQFEIDGRVLLFTLGLAILAGVVFALAPALRISSPSPVPALKTDSTSSDPGSRFNLRNLLVVTQVALSVVLLITAGLFLRSLSSARSIEPGFDSDKVVTVPLNINLLRYTRQQGREFYRQAIERAEAIPGVESASLARIVQLSGGSSVRSLMIEWIANSLYAARMGAILLAGFGVLALLLASVGLYGVMSFAVSRRTRELGIRMALGAQATDVFRLVLGQGMVLVLIGVALGLATAVMVTRLLTSFLYTVSPTDRVTFVAIPLILGVVALVACYLPARRATKVDPLVALRYE